MDYTCFSEKMGGGATASLLLTPVHDIIMETLHLDCQSYPALFVLKQSHDCIHIHTKSWAYPRVNILLYNLHEA